MKAIMVLSGFLPFWLFGSTIQASGEAGTIEYLYRACKQAEEAMNSQNVDGVDLFSGAYCVGYIKATYNMVIINCFAQNAKAGNKQSVKDDHNVSAAALIRSFVKWAEQNPNNWNQGELRAVMPLLQDFPCP